MVPQGLSEGGGGGGVPVVLSVTDSRSSFELAGNSNSDDGAAAARRQSVLESSRLQRWEDKNVSLNTFEVAFKGNYFHLSLWKSRSDTY